MKAYYLVFCISLLISLLYGAKTDIQWRWKLIWVFLPLFVYGAIRVDFGNDYSAYQGYFDLFHSSGFKVDRTLHAEIGYQWLNMIMPSYRSILVLNAFLLYLSFVVFCYNNIPKQYLWLAIILIFLNPEKNIFGTLVAIRSGLCVSSFLLSFVLIQKRRWIPFFIITGLLSYIHTSVLVFMPIAYLLCINKPYSRREMYYWIGGVSLVLVTSMTRIYYIIDVLISNDIFDRYENVLESASSGRGIILVVSCLMCIIGFIVYFNQRGQSLLQYENSLLRSGLLFSLSLLLGSLSMRASFFYDMLYIGSVVKIVSDKEASAPLRYGILLIALVSSYYSMFIVWMGAPYWNHSVYHSLLGTW